jgi:5-methylcytosine-specific restriction endonuclease McrA
MKGNAMLNDCATSPESARKTCWRHRKGRAYADAQNEKAKAYQSTFIGKLALRAGTINTSAKVRGASGVISSGDLLDLWAKQNGVELYAGVRCANCGTMAKDWHADHIVPIKKGGGNNAQNIQLLCVDCHKEKTRDDRNAYEDHPTLFDAMNGNDASR